MKGKKGETQQSSPKPPCSKHVSGFSQKKNMERPRHREKSAAAFAAALLGIDALWALAVDSLGTEGAVAGLAEDVDLEAKRGLWG